MEDNQAPAHFVLTRFNVLYANARGDKNIDPQWLEGRFELFETICLPAMMRQSCQPTCWLVFFDDRTPELFRLRIAGLQRAYARFTPIFCRGHYEVSLAQTAIRERLPADAHWLLTTRLDSDDAIHNRFFENLIAEAVVGRREFLNPIQGLVIAGNRFYRKRDASGPFASLSEPVDGFESVWVAPHHLLSRHGKIRQLRLRDAWLQVVHGGNIANQARGVRAASASIDAATLPPSLAARLCEESGLELVLDNSLGLVSRYARSAVRFAKVRIDMLRS